MFNLHEKIAQNGVLFIAEIGKNFIETADDRPVAEYLENAKKLVDSAVASGADAVKFQTHEVADEVMPVDFVSPHFNAKDRYSWVTRNTLATPLETFWKPISEYCRDKGILFFSTPMSRSAAQKLSVVTPPIWKIGSGDVQDYLVIDYLKTTNTPIIISTGMVSRDELSEVIEYLEKDNTAPVAVLYCISKYPCPSELFNLASIEYLKEKYPNVIVGFSDHSLTSDATFAAIQMGATIIEKHFSFSRELWGADHKVSLSPSEFKAMVDGYNNGTYTKVDPATFYGNKEKEFEGKDNEFRPFFNKALVFAEDLKKGTVLTTGMLHALRPIKLIGGLQSNKISLVVGQKITRDVRKHELVTEDVIDTK